MTETEFMVQTEFMAHIIAEICKFSIDNNMKPDDTLETMANNILSLLKINTFNHWKEEETN